MHFHLRWKESERSNAKRRTSRQLFCCSHFSGCSSVCSCETYLERSPSRARECYWCVGWHPAINRHWMLATMSRVCLLPMLSVIFLQSVVGWFNAQFYTRADQVPSERNEEDAVIGEWAKDYEHLGLDIQTWSVSSPILVSPRVLHQRLCFAPLDRMLSGRTMSLA